MDALFSVVRFFVAGGPFMYPILIVFAFGIAIAIERYITLTLVKRQNEGMWSKLEPALASGDFDKAREMTSKDDSTISQLLGMGLARQGAVRRREDIEIAMEESMMEIIPQLEKRTPYVALASSIATLLGLLGTIMGLIQAFTAVANANPAEKADLLSASISVAMNTTAFGLMSRVAVRHGHEFHMVAEFGVLGGNTSGADIAIVRMRSERNDAQLAVAILGRQRRAETH